MSRILFVILVWFVFACSARPGFAQGADPPDLRRARNLLGGYLAAFDRRPVNNIIQSFSLTTYEGERSSVIHARYVLDYDLNRAAIETYEVKENERALVERIVVLRDKSYRIDIEHEDVNELSPRAHERFSAVFTEASMGFLPIDFKSVRYTREARYGDLVAGEEVAATPAIRNNSLHSVRLVFSSEGNLLAVVRELVGGRRRLQITKYTEPITFQDLKNFGNKTFYEFDERTGTARRTATMEVEDFSVNSEIDESLFRVDDKAY